MNRRQMWQEGTVLRQGTEGQLSQTASPGGFVRLQDGDYTVLGKQPGTLESSDPHCTYTLTCPDSPTALPVYREKCAQRLRPRSGGKGQLAPKALLQPSGSPKKSQLRVFPNTTKRSLELTQQLSKEPAIRTQNVSWISLCLTSSGLC